MSLDILNLVGLIVVLIGLLSLSRRTHDLKRQGKRLEDIAQKWQVDPERIRAQREAEERERREQWEREHAKKLELLLADPNRPVGGGVRVEMVNGKWREVE